MHGLLNFPKKATSEAGMDKRARQISEKRGKRAELIAAIYLFLKGYKILKRRFRSRRGEIDLICKRGQTLVFIEVKARKTVDDAKQAITYKQKKRIEACSEDWLKLNAKPVQSLRFDIIAIVPGRFPAHIRDAWRPDTAYNNS